MAVPSIPTEVLPLDREADPVASPLTRFSLLTPECVRIEWAPDGRFVDEPSVFATARGSLPPLQVVVAEGREPVTIKAPGFTLDYRTDGEPPSPKNLIVASHDGLCVWRPGDRPSRNLGGTLSTLDGLRGSRPVGHGLLSRDGWALIDDSDGHLLHDNWAVCRSWRGYAVDGRIDWYLFLYGNDFTSALNALAKISGPVPLPRRSALGSWYSRYWPHTSDDFRTIAREFDARGFPLDIMVLDMDWHSGSAQGRWTGWSWNRDLLPDAERLIDWLHDRGIKTCLNLHPSEGVGSWEARYASFMRALGLDPITGERLAFDAGNKRYMQALFDEILRPLERPGEPSTNGPTDQSATSGTFRAGVDLWWLDWQQEAIVRSIPGLTNLAWLNRLFFDHSHKHNRRGTGFSRWAGWGDHRHPIHFSGDAHTGWPMLAFQVPFTVTAGNTGCFFWSHDIGGHFGPRFEETSTRWVQFGALSAALRLHSARTSSLDRRPWSFAPDHESAMRKAFRLRSALMPTIYSAAQTAARDTLPLLRPTWLTQSTRQTPVDEHAFRSPDQYLLGDNLLVAPIVCAGVGAGCVAERAVWFPPTPSGAWAHLVTGERFPAGRHALVAAMLDEIPLFARAGSAIVMQPPSLRMSGCLGIAQFQVDVDHASQHAGGTAAGSAPIGTRDQHLVLRVTTPEALPCAFTTTLYEDDGESDAHERGDFAATRISGRWEAAADGRIALDLTISGAVGSHSNQLESRRWTIEVVDPGVSIHELQGPFSLEADPPDGLGPSELPVAASIASPACPIRQPLTLRATMHREQPVESELLHRVRRLSGLVGEANNPVELLSLLNSLDLPLTPEREQWQACAWAIATGVGAAWRTVGPCAEPRVAPPAAVVADPFDKIDTTQPVLLEVIDRVNGLERVVVARDLPAHSDLPASLYVNSPNDQPAEPPVGRTAARLVRLTAWIHGSKRAITRQVVTRRRPIRAWRVLGPFDWDWRWGVGSHTLPPEQSDSLGVDPVLEPMYPPHPHAPPITPAHHAPSAPQSSHPAGWTRGRSSAVWGLDLTATFPDRRGAAWAEAVVFSGRRQQATLLLETADKLLVRLNNERVFTLDDHSGPEAASMQCRCELREGSNLIQVKLTHGWNDWGLNLFVEAHHAVEEQPSVAVRPGTGQ